MTPTALAPPDAPPGVIRVRGLHRSFGSTVALAPTDLEIGPGGITGLLGPNGSGKSTLLRSLIGVVPRGGGSVWIDGVELTGDGLAIRRRATYAPGELAVYGRMRGEAHLRWLLAGRGEEAIGRACEMAEALGLPLSHRLRTYSHGMKRQVFFVAAMAPRLRVRLLDEVTEGLDPSKRGTVLELLREDAARGTTILLSSHHLGEVQRVCDRMIFMKDGRILNEESAEEILSRSRRLVRLRFDPEDVLGPLEEAAKRAGAERVVLEGHRVTLHLREEDPRASLVALFREGHLPRPLAIEYGELSLEELYRELYGEEAC